jgi:hypothetical protein
MRRTRARHAQEEIMHKLIVLFTLLALAGCGVETATTAATGAAIKKREVEEGKKTMEQAQKKIGEAMEQSQQRAEKDADK